ncbi:MAG: AAA family ATPase [Phycisphaerales bacterium]
MADRSQPSDAAERSTNDVDALRRALASPWPCVAIATSEERYAQQVVAGALVDSPLPLLTWSVTQGLRDGRYLDGKPIPQTEHPAAALYHIAGHAPQPVAAVFFDLAGHLDDQRTMRTLREAIERCRAGGGTIVLVDAAERLPEVVEGEAFRIELSLPDEAELEAIVRRTVQECHHLRPVVVELTRGVLRSIVRNLRGLSRGQAERAVRDCIADDRRFDERDLARIVVLKRNAISSAHGGSVLEFVRTPEDLADIGGLRRLKRWLMQRRRSFDERAASFGLRPPRGVLLLGVQGAGKSLCAKAIASAWKLPLLRLDPGALYDRYVGESEKRLRDALRHAGLMSPIVLWIDEIEKGFASAASRSTDGGLSQRMFGTLLTWMQERRDPVFLVATANDIEALPPELLRKGRFDEIFFVDLPNDEARREILAIHLRGRDRDPSAFDLDALVAASDRRSGAEIEEAIVSALHEAFERGAEIDTASIQRALEGSPPLAVTMRERIDELREWSRGRCVPADE